MSSMNFNIINVLENPHGREILNKRVEGRQMKALGLKRITEIQRMKALGICKPASIINLNPVALRLEGGVQGKVPSVIDPAVNQDSKLEFAYKGKLFRATIVTYQDPVFYPWITDVNLSPGQTQDEGVGVYDIKVYKQIEMAYNFWQDYNGATFNAIKMGGVIAFEGDKHVLKGDTIKVPCACPLPNYEREFITQERSFLEELARALDTQREYYNLRMQIAGGYWNDPDQRKNITNMDLVWAQYGLDMGWREKPVDWHVGAEESGDGCEGCGAARARALAYFCHKCGRSYDPFVAYMDGELGFESAQLNRIAAEKWPVLIAEENRRRSLRGLAPIGSQNDSLNEPKPPKAKAKEEKDKKEEGF